MSVVRQQALTVVASLARGREEQAESWLREHKRALQRALERSSTTHFARWVLLPPTGEQDQALASSGSSGSPQQLLAFESNFDGSLEDHVSDLRACLGPLLDGAFAGVEGYPGSTNLPALSAFFREAALRAAAFFVAHGGLSVPVVRGDARLRLAVEARLKERSLGAKCQADDALELASDLQRTARGLAQAEGLTLGPVDRGLVRNPPGWLATALTRPFSVIGALLLAPFFEFMDERARRFQPSFDTPELRKKRDQIGLEEDQVEQNGLTHLVPLKPGKYRPFALKMMVLLVTSMAAAGALVGRLGGIETIHFARWVVLPDRRLLFFSNYDGSWEAYLGDFIDKASFGLTMIWTNTLWYPKTHFLLLQGARDEGAFKRWTRAYQVPTQVWYSAYPTLSVGDVLRNAELRELLGSALTPARAERLLALL